MASPWETFLGEEAEEEQTQQIADPWASFLDEQPAPQAAQPTVSVPAAPPLSQSEQAQPPSLGERFVQEFARLSPVGRIADLLAGNVIRSRIAELSEPGPTPAERSINAAGELLRGTFDVLQRGQYASANVAEALVEGRAQDIPEAIAGGLRGTRRGDYIAILDEQVPAMPKWLRTGLGFLLNVALDPSTYLGIGAVGRTGERLALSFAGRSLLPESVNRILVGSVEEAARRAAQSTAGRWIAEKLAPTAGSLRRIFDPAAQFADRDLYEAYRRMRDEIHYLIRVADQNRIPREQAVEQIEQNLGIPRSVVTELIERPVIYEEELRGARALVPEETRVVQPPLPLSRTVTRSIANPRRIIGRVNEQIEQIRLQTKGAFPPGYTRDIGPIRRPEDIPQAKEFLFDLYLTAMSDTLAKAADTGRIPPWFERFGVRPLWAAIVLRNREVDNPVYQELRREAMRQLDLGQIVPDFPKEWADLYDTLTLLESPEFQERIVRTVQRPLIEQGLPFTEEREIPLARERTLFRARQAQSGDTLETLAARHGTTVSRIKALNPELRELGERQPIPEGTEVRLPFVQSVERTVPVFDRYTAAEGDTLEAIAAAKRTTVERLKEINPSLRRTAADAPVPAGTEIQVPFVRAIDRLSGQPELLRMTVADFHEWGTNRVGIEQAAGVEIVPLDDQIEYVSHYLLPEAKRALGKDWDRKWRRLLSEAVQHPSTRARSTRNLTIAELNRMAERGELIPGYRGKALIDDPVLAEQMRDVLSARAIGMAHFLDGVKARPEWAARAEDAPEEFRELSEATRERLGRLVEGWRFAPEVADTLERVVRVTFDPKRMDPLLRGWQAGLASWRTITLGFSPTWISNNIIGNVWNSVVFAGNTNPENWTDAGRILWHGRRGVARYQVRRGDTLSGIAERLGLSTEELARANGITDPDRILAGQTLVIPQGERIAGRTENELLDLAERHGVVQAGLYGRQLEELGQSTAAAVGRFTGAELAFRANAALENHARLSLFLDGLRKGMSPEEAAARVRRYLFDYSELTDAEKNVLRNIFPFYTFWRKEMPLLLEAAITRPGVFGVVPKTISALQADTDTLQAVDTAPPYIREGLYAQTESTPEGTTAFRSLRGLPPSLLLESGLYQMATGRFGPGATQLGRFLLSQNPVLSGIAAQSGVSLFSGREIPEESETRVVGIPIPTRTAELLFSLVPPLRTLSGIASPYTDARRQAFGLDQSLADRIVEFVTGSPVVLRNRYLDLQRTLDELNRRVNAAQRNLENAAVLNPDELDMRIRELGELLDAQARLTELFALLEAQVSQRR